MTAPHRRELPPLPPTIRRVHLIGICGTGMGSLAGMLVEAGYQVGGSDQNAYPPMSTWLESRGITIQRGYLPEHLDWAPDLVVVGNVCRRDNPEAVEALARGITCLSFPETLRTLFLTGRTPLVVAGTHGKTTTCSLLAWLLYSAGLAPSFMIGGLVQNFNANFRLDHGDPFVVEGDEYDTAFFDKVPKFWHYAPHRALINNIEFDHGDIYQDIDEIQWVFEELAALVDPDGSLWVNAEDHRALQAARRARCPVATFGLSPDADLHPVEIHYTPEGTEATLLLRGASLGRWRSPLLGAHNLRNLLGALALALDAGADLERLRDGLPAFQSVRKRQELRGTAGGVDVYDDFAHHPTAVRETLGALRQRFPARRLWAIFEAKSNTSRMARFQDDYLAAFQRADQVILSAPWKQDAHLRSDEKIDLARLADDLTAQGIPARFVPDLHDIVTLVAAEARPGDVVLAMSGSDFGGLHAKLLEALTPPGA